MKTSLRGFARHIGAGGPKNIAGYIVLCVVLPADAVVLALVHPAMVILAGVWAILAFVTVRKEWREYAAGTPATRYSDG